MQPFFIRLSENQLKFIVRELNIIPEEICFDLKIYKAILYPLIKNAIKSTKKGELTILIDLFYVSIIESDP